MLRSTRRQEDQGYESGYDSAVRAARSTRGSRVHGLEWSSVSGVLHRRRSGSQPRNKARICHGSHLRSEEHTSELQSLMRISYAVFCLKNKKEHRDTNAVRNKTP